MTCQPPVPFGERLAQARAMVERGPSAMPDHVADQLGAAGRATRRIYERLASSPPILALGRTWSRRTAAGPSGETRAYLLAAIMGCGSCVHLREGGPQPAVARLALRRVDCERCSATVSPPATGGDECDVCGVRGVGAFRPFAIHLGPALVGGEACAGCAEALGIGETGAPR